MIETVYHMPVPVRIALLTDSHNMDPAPVTASLAKNCPELILIAGDIVYGERGITDGQVLEQQKNVLPLLQSCTRIAPVFMSWGNHDRVLGPDDLRRIQETGITVLDNEYALFSIGDKEIVIGGLTSAWITDYRKRSEVSGVPVYLLKKKGKDPAVPEYRWLNEYAEKPGYHILLSHHPEYLPYIPDGVELIVSGHAHGGQWCFFNRGVFAPGQGFFARMISGIIQERMVLSRGLSNPMNIPRINNPTEIVYIME